MDGGSGEDGGVEVEQEGGLYATVPPWLGLFWMRIAVPPHWKDA